MMAVLGLVLSVDLGTRFGRTQSVLGLVVASIGVDTVEEGCLEL